MAVHSRLVALTLSIGLSGCLGIGQSRELQVRAPTWAAHPRAADLDPEMEPENPSQVRFTPRNTVDPLRVLAHTTPIDYKPQTVREPRHRLVSLSPDINRSALPSTAFPLVLENPSGILARIAAVQAIHQRDLEETRRKERKDEQQIQRITKSICSGC